MTDDTDGWSNWSDGVQAEPDEIVRPTDEADVQALVRSCRESGATLRVAGAGHSWSPLVATEGVILSLDRMTGVTDVDRDVCEASVRGGTTLEEAGIELHDAGLAMATLGDVSNQTVAGAFGTGTHGSGTDFQNLSESLIGGRLVDGTGEIVTFDRDDESLLSAARVSLGTLGIFTEVRLDLQPTYKVQRREYCASFRAFWPHRDRLFSENRNADFYWYPRSDEVKVRLLNPPGGGTDHRDLDYAEQVTDETGWWHLTIPAHNEIGRPFEEMEYAVPTQQGPRALLAVRDRIRDRWRADVGWRVLCRRVAADDAYLSPEYDRDTMTISLIQNAQLSYWPYFEDLEPLLRSFDGRPHWGKRHTIRAAELQRLYPAWEHFHAIRAACDPDGVFLTPYLHDLLDPPAEPPPIRDPPVVTAGAQEETGDEDAPVGHRRWIVPGGYVPVVSRGPEPAMVSHDKLCLLNVGDEMAAVTCRLRYAEEGEMGPYPLTVAPRRVRHVRINDLIDPHSPPLGRAFGLVVESTVPIVVQYSRQDTGSSARATLSTIAYSE